MVAERNSSGLRVLTIATIALLLFLGVVFMGFFRGSDNAEPQTDGDGLDPDAMLCLSWPVPKVALILSGEQDGYIEPCGCTENQSGGLSRRGNLIKQLQDLKWKTAGLDLGGIVRRDRLQSQLKFRTMLVSLKDLNYKAIGLGAKDIKLGPDYLLSQHTPEDPESIAYVCANVTFYDSTELGTPARTRTFEEGGLKFGVTGVLGKSLELELKQVQDVKVEEPTEAIKSALESLEAADVDIRILLSHGSMDEGKQLAAQFPEFDIVLTAGGAEDPAGTPAVVGETLLLDVGHKGKHTAVLGIYPDGNPKYRFELVQLDRVRFKDTQKMVDHMQFYQKQLEQQQIMIAESPVGHPSGASFVGSDTCAECHEEEYEIWKKTPHASAFLSLDPANKRHGYERLKGVSRLYDPECVCCHVTGWNPEDVYRYRSGYIAKAFAGTDDEIAASKILKGVGCENCHGPGSQHIDLANDGEDEQAAALMRVTKEQANTNSGCYKCHDLDNSPKFDFDKYWPKIAH